MQCIPQYMKSFPWVSLCPSLSLRADGLPASVSPTKKAEKPVKRAFSACLGFFAKRTFSACYDSFLQSGGHGARTRNPITGHHISSVAANHSLTLRKHLSYISLRYAVSAVKPFCSRATTGATKAGD